MHTYAHAVIYVCPHFSELKNTFLESSESHLFILNAYADIKLSDAVSHADMKVSDAVSHADMKLSDAVSRRHEAL
jgi:hypothetical protein